MNAATKAPLADLFAGAEIGMLTLLRPDLVPIGQRKRWVCRCKCGTEKSVEATRLRTRAVMSCGCYQLERLLQTHTKHGHSKAGAPSPTYVSWANMKDRCTRPKNKNFADYGGKGITVCEQWMSFEGFLADMGEPPESGMTIERVDNALGYQPGNCVWASRLVQANNRCMNWTVVSGGTRMTATQFALQHGPPPRTFRKHLATGRRVFGDIEIQAIQPYEGK